MGFPLLRSTVCTEDLRFADLNFGGLATRLAESLDPERDPAFEGRLVALAFESASHSRKQSRNCAKEGSLRATSTGRPHLLTMS
jgi:hypothetical protein